MKARFVRVSWVAVALVILSACGASRGSDPPQSLRTTQSSKSTSTRDAKLDGLLVQQRRVLSASKYRFVSSLVKTDESVLTTIRRQAFSDGTWQPRSPTWQTPLELGYVAALVARETGLVRFSQLATLTVNTAIRKHQIQDGAFAGDSPGYLPNQPSQFATGSALVSIGTAYLELEPDLSEQQRGRWRSSLQRAGMWLARDIHFYVNGNVNLQGALGLYLAWRATGDKQLMAAYNSAWEFALHPGRGYPGRGLVYTRRPTGDDGLNGAAYLTEQAQGAPGFDPHYTILQADYVAELVAVSHAPRALKLLNLLVNQLFTRINHRNLFIQTGGGSRDPKPSQNAFISASLPILAYELRPDLLTFVPKQEATAGAYFRNWAKTGLNEDQIVGNYSASLLAFQSIGRG
jgi:hypothetical protein